MMIMLIKIMMIREGNINNIDNHNAFDFKKYGNIIKINQINLININRININLYSINVIQKNMSLYQTIWIILINHQKILK